MEGVPSLLVVTQRDITHMPLEGAVCPDCTLHALDVRALDYRYDSRDICYVNRNVSRARIVCARADRLSQSTDLPLPSLFPDVEAVSHLAIDWLSGNWYLVDEGREVMYMCEKMLVHCRLLVDHRLDKVRGFAIDPTRGLMFWSVWGGSAPEVGRAELDGSARKALASLKLVYPGALTLDLTMARVYWADSYLDCIERADYDGGHRKTIRRGFVAQQLAQLSVFEGTVWAPTWGERAVLGVPTRSRGSPVRIPLSARPTAAVVYHRQRQPLVSHPCRIKNGGCAHICVTAWSKGQPRAQCLCAHGYRSVVGHDCIRVRIDTYLLLAKGAPPMVRALSPSAHVSHGSRAALEPLQPLTDVARPTAIDYDLASQYIYYSDVHRYEIARRKMEGGPREVFISEDVDNCEGLAVDWLGRNLYWTDDASGQISVAKLDRPAVRAVLLRSDPSNNDSLIYNPRSIVVDPVNGMMYWTQWASAGALGAARAGRISAARMDGAEPRTLLAEDLHWPNGLTLLRATNTLYWCDTYLNKIESMNADGTGRRIVAQHSAGTPLSKPYGLALHEGLVLWSEHDTGLVRRLWNASYSDTLHADTPPLYDLRLVDPDARMGTNACLINNGGCEEFCLAKPGGRTCACASGRELDESGRSCRAAVAPPRPARCPPGHFHCGRGRCIDEQFKCDGDADCPDGSDEDSSPSGPCVNVPCPDDHFKCDTNRCILNKWVCDGIKDCRDGTDEEASACARAECGPDQFACAHSHRCIPAAWRCDGGRDCGPGDDSDEAECKNPECQSMAFTCDSGACIPWEYYCDGYDDCREGSDERSCGAVSTPAPTQPAPPARNDLHHRMHDVDNGGVCEQHEFQCVNKECIRMEFRCDSRVDCLDGSDEVHCNGTAVLVRTTTTPAPTVASGAGAACEPPALRCDNGTRCVPLLQLCDGRADCADAADEGDRCGEPMCEMAMCTHLCLPSPGGPVCSCPAHLHLQRDGFTCAEAHPCTDWGVCSQTCQPQKNRHKCTCYEGYQLADDGFTCKSTDRAPPLLVFSNRHELCALELPTLTSRALVSSLKNTIAVDWYRDNDTLHLYWTDVIDDKIYRGTVLGTSLRNIEPVVEAGLSTAEGLAVDWVGRNLYWVESNLHQIEVARLDGRYRRTLVAGDMESPRAIAADPRKGYLFWTDWEQQAPRIERCTLAGTERITVVRVDWVARGAWPNGITLDYAAERVYWIDARSDSIHTTLYDGSAHREVLRGHETLSHPFALTLFESHVYWTDWRSNSVVRADKWRGGDVAVVQRTLTQPFDLKVVHPSRQPRGAPHPCETDNGGCSHLCLVESATVRRCACPHVMRLAADGVRCEPHERVLLVARGGEVRGLDLDEPAVHTIPTVSGPQLAQPTSLQFLAADYALFWIDVATNEIKRTGLTRGPLRTVVDTGLESPRGFALDWLAHLLFYTSARPGGDVIAVCTLAGERHALLFDESAALHNITSLAVDPRRGKLYWSHSVDGFERIEEANEDGSARRTLVTYGADPQLAGVVGLTIDVNGHRLYWVNSDSATMQYYELGSGKSHTLSVGGRARPSALEVHGSRLYWADTEEGTLHVCDKDACADDRLLRNGTEGVVSLRVYDADAQKGDAGACALRAQACAHLCLPTSDKTSVCTCAAGYRAHGVQCVGVSELLVYSMNWEVRGLALDGTHTPVLGPLSQLGMATSIDFYAAEDYLYWADSEHGMVWRVRRDGTGRQLLTERAPPADAQPRDWLSGLAIDWAAGNMYWSDSQRNLVEVGRLDGASRYVLLDSDPLTPTALAVDPVHGWLFLAGGGWIQRARLDGSDLRLLYNGTAVTDIALDPAARQIYWTDNSEVAIWRSSYEGEGRTAVVRGAALQHPVAVAVHADTLYWLDTMLDGGSVLSAPLGNTSASRVLLSAAGDSLKDLLVRYLD
ncbi:Low-density lipoprotein receptor-related protein 1 [Eumeta japonica]|uniref:Low-density lipoprotein receptor-related protein 1 n=1 Tax=Eumeta variegata TaxID=151549 RepID=A0A4C1VEL0_EUMVA|nr:Low-density lipoprotein receptor-related protein 1 [Eumeta japonica]